MTTAIALAIIFAILAIIMQLWSMWSASYNRNRVNRRIARLITDQRRAMVYTEGGELEWLGLEAPTFKAQA